MNEQDKEIRERIRKILIKCRTEKGISQLELAMIIGSKPTTIASWEQGLSLPNIQTLYKLSKLYDKSIGYMYGEEK